MSHGKSINKEQLQNRNSMYYEINNETPYTRKAIGYYENGKRFKAEYQRLDFNPL